jgi:hypothetical protein
MKTRLLESFASVVVSMISWIVFLWTVIVTSLFLIVNIVILLVKTRPSPQSLGCAL